MTDRTGNGVTPACDWIEETALTVGGSISFARGYLRSASWRRSG
jgi:hypothetical protein